MKSLFGKRRKSVAAGLGDPLSEEKPPMPVPGSAAALPTLDKVRMPDLRFSRLDLDPISGGEGALSSAFDNRASGQDWLSPLQTSQQQLLNPRTLAGGGPSPKRSSSHTNLTASGQPTSSPQPKASNTMPRSATSAPSKGGINGLFQGAAPAAAAVSSPVTATEAQKNSPGDSQESEQRKRRSSKTSTPPRSPPPKTPPPDFPPPAAPSYSVKNASTSAVTSPSQTKSAAAKGSESTRESPVSPRRQGPAAEASARSSPQKLSTDHRAEAREERRASRPLTETASSSSSLSSRERATRASVRPDQARNEQNSGVAAQSQGADAMRPMLKERRKSATTTTSSSSRSRSPLPPMSEHEKRVAQLTYESEKSILRAKEDMEYKRKRMEELERMQQRQPASQQQARSQTPVLQQPSKEALKPPQQQGQGQGQSRIDEEAGGKKTSSLKKRLSSFGLSKKKDTPKEVEPQMPTPVMHTKEMKIQQQQEQQQPLRSPRPPPQQAPASRSATQPQQQSRGAPSTQQPQQPQQPRAPGTVSSKSSQKNLKADASQRQAQPSPSSRRAPSPQPSQKSSQSQRQKGASEEKKSSATSKPKPKQPAQQAQQSQQVPPPSAKVATKQKPAPAPTKVPGQGKDGGQMAAFQFPRPSQEQVPSSDRRSPQPRPSASRSNSALAARDGVAKPIPPPRGMTQDDGKYSGIKPSSQYSSQHDAITSSSSETTTTDGVGSHSQETNPSSAYRSPDDGSDADVEEDDGDYQHRRTARKTPESMAEARPRRDEERAERAQSRLSMNLDGETEANASQQPQSHQRTDSKFGALLAGAKHEQNKLSSSKASSILDMDDERRTRKPSVPARRQREKERAVPVVKREPNPDLIFQGVGWKTHGLADASLVQSHDRLETVAVLVPKAVRNVKKEREQSVKEEDAEAEAESDAEADKTDEIESEEEEVQVEYAEEMQEVRYNDLFELVWTATTPDVIRRLVSHLDFAEIKALRQTSANIRFTLSSHREMILSRYLACVGYTPWKVTATTTGINPKTGKRMTTVSRDPCPLSFADCEAFMLSHDLLPEYAAVGKEYAMAPSEMDPRLPRLARATTRAYNRVLTRLRLQPTFKLPNPPSSSIKTPLLPSPSGSRLTPSPSHSPLGTPGEGNGMPRANSYYTGPSPQHSGGLSPGALPNNESMLGLSSSSPKNSPIQSPKLDTASPVAQQSPQLDVNAAAPVTLPSPYKPGRAVQYRVWVPAMDPSGWLSDEELTRCEGELYRSGMWHLLRRGDVVWDVAIGDSLNEGKFIFDGHYLRDLSYAYDVAGHLPSWLNSFIYPPSYWHNVLRSSTSQPVIYLDVSPFKDQILSSLRLVQDHVDNISPQGRYRIAKWLYRAIATTTAGHIISQMDQSLQVVDAGWHGKIVIETEGECCQLS